MPVQFNKRVNLGNGLGVNISKSGFSSSYRTKYGTFGSRGFSIKTGIPGVTFRHRFSKSKKLEDALLGLVILLFVGAFILVGVLIWNLLRMIWYGLVSISYSIEKVIRDLKIKREVKKNENNDSTVYLEYNKNFIPDELKRKKAYLKDVFTENNSFISKGSPLLSISIGNQYAEFSSDFEGKITFYRYPGERIKFGDIIYKIDTEKKEVS
jgi:hypothetical protein